MLTATEILSNDAKFLLYLRSLLIRRMERLLPEDEHARVIMFGVMIMSTIQFCLVAAAIFVWLLWCGGMDVVLQLLDEAGDEEKDVDVEAVIAKQIDGKLWRRASSGDDAPLRQRWIRAAKGAATLILVRLRGVMRLSVLRCRLWLRRCRRPHWKRSRLAGNRLNDPCMKSV